MRRAAVSMATLLPLIIVIFAWLYFIMSNSDHSMFNVVLSKTDSLYFTVTVLSTVGFGDITAQTETSRLVVTVQMITNLIVVAVLFRALFDFASRREAMKKAERQST